jgi:hypothetical protein
MNVLRDLKYGLRTLTKRPVFSLSRMTVALLSVIGGLSFAQVLAAGEVLEDVVERRFPLDPSGTFSLRAIDGTVEIFGTDSREVKIVATKKAFSMERLNAIAIRVDARADAVNIETTPPLPPSHRFSDRSGTVEYTINVPQTARIAGVELPHGELVIDGMRGTSIAANLGSGQLVTHNCFCDQNIHVNKGVLNVFFDWLEEERPISIEAGIEDGNMAARFPTDATFHLHAVSKEGHVSSDFSPMETRKRGDDSEINEVIGDAPTTKLNFRASEGNIHISEVIW